MCAAEDSGMIKMIFSNDGGLTSLDSFLNSYVLGEDTMSYTVAILHRPEAPSIEDSIIFRNDRNEHIFAEVTLRNGTATSIVFFYLEGVILKKVPVQKNGKSKYTFKVPKESLGYTWSSETERSSGELKGSLVKDRRERPALATYNVNLNKPMEYSLEINRDLAKYYPQEFGHCLCYGILFISGKIK